MQNWFQKYFIPHEDNDHKPHILRWEATLGLISLVLIAELAFLSVVFVFGPRSGFLAEIISSVLVDGTNYERTASDIKSLKTNALLEQAAKMKAEDMASKGYFAHTSPEGITPWYWIQRAGYKFSYAGENLAVNFVDSNDALRAWMNSPAHKANILNHNFTEIGIATAQGTFEGRNTIFIVQFFGTPAPMPAPLVSPRPRTAVRGVATTSMAVASSGGTAFVPGSVAGSEATTSATSSEIGAVKDAPAIDHQELLSTPHRAINVLYLTIATIILLALLLAIFVRIQIQHPRLLVNGVLLLIIIAGAMALNQYLVFAAMKVG